MVYFHEEQRFQWFWIVMFLFPAALVGYGLYQEVWQGKSLGGYTASYVLWLPAFAMTVTVAVLFMRLKLVVEVRPDILSIHFLGLRPEHKVPWSDIVRVEAVTYRPVRDYGGWGVRVGPRRGIVYNVKGDRGVRVYLTNGKRLLIGSQRPDELAKVMAERLAPVA